MSHESYNYASQVLVRGNSRLEHLFFWKWIEKLADILERFDDRAPSFVFVIAVAILLVLSVASSRGGYAHPELEQYIPHYLSQRPLLEKIFDFKKVEIVPVYRPRPLSYVVDDFDVAFIAWSCRHGFPHLLSASYYLFWAFGCLLLWLYFRRHLQIHRVTSGLLICLLSTDSVVFSNANYFRSAKPGGTFLLLSTFVVFAECFRATLRKRPAFHCAVLAGSAALLLFCACLFDEIPVAYAVSAAVILGVECFLARNSSRARAPLYALVAILAVLFFFAWYDFVLHPKLIQAISGEKVSLAYQTGTAAALLWNPPVTLAGSISVFAEVFARLAGSVSAVLALILLLALVSVWVPPPDLGSDAGRRNRQHALIRILLGVLLMVGCLYGMISRHHAVMRNDVRHSQYVIPLTTVFVLFFAATAAIVVQKGYLSRGKLELVLIVLIFSNLVFVLGQRVFSHGDQFTEILLFTLRNPGASISVGSGDPQVVASLQREVLKNPIYKSLHSIMTEPK